MFFNFDNFENVIIHERFNIVKIRNINDIIQHVLRYMQQNFYKARKIIFRQINKHKNKINYKLNDKIFLFNRNIIINRSFKKFEIKMLKFFSIEKKIEIFYQLQLLNFIKVYDVFHFYLMHKNSNNSLFEQVQKSSESIIIKENKKYKLNNINNFY